MRYKLLGGLFFLLAASVVLSGCGTTPPPPIPPCIEPDPEMQSLFLNASQSNSAQDSGAALQSLYEKVRADRVKGVQQSLVFVASSTQENRWQMVLKMYEDLTLSKEEMLQSTLPCLESGDTSMDEPVRSVVLPFLVSKTAPGNADFSFMQVFLSKRKDAPPLKLVKMLYQSSPGASMEVMASVYIEDATEKGLLLVKRDLIGGDRLNLLFDQTEKRRMTAPGVREALLELAASPHWWVRLYIAEVIGHTRGFTDDKINGLLAEDSHELVREAITLQVNRGGRG
jgi:hypothetical protein